MKTKAFTLWISFLLSVLVAVTAVAGLFWPATYAQEKPLWAAEGAGGDAVNLFVIVPVLIVSAVLAHRGSLSARLIWMGTLVCILYNAVIYAFAVHFNSLFLIYCAVLGLSFYALAGSVPSLSPSEVAAAYAQRAPVRTTAVVLLLIAFVFGAQWLRELIPPLLSGHTPQSIIETGLMTNPVYVLDLSVVLPGFVITAIMLLRRKPEAFILAPVLMVFVILMTVAIAGMSVAMVLKGYATSYMMAVFFLASAGGCTVLLIRFFGQKTMPFEAPAAGRAAQR
jgi:hypothetical protein